MEHRSITESERSTATVDRTPPLLPFVLSLGVTGHRSDALADAVGLDERVRAALTLLRDRALAIHRREPQWFSATPPRLQFISPLADGADQIAAEIALDLGFELHGVLPFARHDYVADFSAAGRARFDALITRASCALELPGNRQRALEAYVMAGRATVAHCDLLLAVWDGLPARGRGGTAEVVQLAILRGTPVLHLPVDADRPARLLWAAFDPAVLTLGEEVTAERPFTPDHVEQALAMLLLPPADTHERHFFQQYAAERLRRIRARIEYPLLLAAAGVKRFRPGDIREKHCADAIASEWRDYRAGCAGSDDMAAGLDQLERAYSWSDQLATHFAQTYRSGHVFNFVLGGFAVCLGLASFMWPHALLPMAVFEFVITLAIILNTKIGIKHEWHRRWLDYRQLAERLRPMRSLKLLGLAAPDPPGTATNPVPRRWIDWYAGGVWRAMGCPPGAIDRARIDQLASAVADHEIAPQVAYHNKSAHQIDALDHRLEAIASMLFWITLFATVATVAGRAFAPDLLNRANNWFTLIGAGFPAIGTAVFGIRFQGDFGGSALRSQATANRLGEIDSELRKGVGLNRAADLAEQAARTMLSDLDEWRLVNQQHDLGIA